MAAPLLLLTLAFILLSTTASTASPLSPHQSPSSYPAQTHPLHLFGPILSTLGFNNFASAAHSLSNTTTTWRGPITVFAPTDSSLLTCSMCSLPLLLHEHTVPGLFPLAYMRTLAFGTKIETLAPGKCLTITTTSSTHNNNASSKIFVGGVEITHPDLYNDGLVVVHPLRGFISHVSPFSCNIERMTSLSFLPPPQPQTIQDTSFVMRMMLRDAMLRLRLSGYSIVAIALRVKWPDLVDLKAVTVFALNDATIFSSGGHEYVTSFRFHVVPNRLLMAGDLELLPAGTVLPTLNQGQDLVVTSGGVPLAPVRINYVRIERPNLMFNLKMVIHGLSMPFPHLNLTDVIGSGQIGRSAYDAGGSEWAGNSDVSYSMSPPSSGIKWTDEIEDHHGL